MVRAARVESGGVELGARAPDFELPEPLTGNVWRLDDFELYPCLLVSVLSFILAFVVLCIKFEPFVLFVRLCLSVIIARL